MNAMLFTATTHGGLRMFKIAVKRCYFNGDGALRLLEVKEESSHSAYLPEQPPSCDRRVQPGLFLLDLQVKEGTVSVNLTKNEVEALQRALSKIE